MSSWRRRSCTLPPPLILLLTLPPHHHSWPRSIVPQPQMRPTRQAHRAFRRLAENAQTDATHKANIHHLPVAETRSAEVDTRLRRADEVCAGSCVGQKGEKEGRQEAVCRGCAICGRTLSTVKRDVRPVRGVGGLLQEGRRAGQGEHIDGDLEALRGEDGVHERDVLRGRSGGDGEHEDTRGERRGCVERGGHGAGGGARGREEHGLLVDVRKSESQGAR